MLLAKAQWGTVADWVTAFGTLAAFFVALRLLAKELAARREQEEDRRRVQARLVNAWPTVRWRESDGEAELLLVVKNASDEPVYQVRCTVVPGDSDFRV
jgi:CO/xanthine dehydrogenase Mo-binding subunit